MRLLGGFPGGLNLQLLDPSHYVQLGLSPAVGGSERNTFKDSPIREKDVP